MSRPWVRAGVLIWLAASVACTRAVEPAVTPSAPTYLEYSFPQPPAKGGDERLASQHRSAWALLQSGDLSGADREYRALVRLAPDYVPAQVGFGYVLLAEQSSGEAMVRFEQVIRTAPGYAPAYVARAEAYLAIGQRDQALASFEYALKLDPRLSDASRRVEVIKFSRVRELVTTAKRAADEGRLEDARRTYTNVLQLSPESAVLYRDLAGVEIRLNALVDAVQHLRKSVALDGGDVRALTALGDALEKQGDLAGATDAYQRALVLDGSEEIRRARDRLLERAPTTRWPAEYRAIPRLSQVTRGDVAAMLGVRLPSVLAMASRRGPTVVATDVREHWASTWILAVTRANVMEVYANHTFQPTAGMRRVGMAQVVARMLALITPKSSPPTARLLIADVPTDHLSYSDVAVAVSSGIMELLDGGLFRPSRPLGGAEAADIVDRLERLAKRPKAGATGGEW
jgi:tetratricopeptide (TPR) repeat protein